MDNYIKSATDYVINSKTRDLKDFNRIRRKCMTNEMTNTPPFKVKCIDGNASRLTLGKEYEVVEVEVGFYKIENDRGVLESYFQERFEIVETLIKDKQEFSVGDKVVVNKISDDFVSDNDDNVKVGDENEAMDLILDKAKGDKDGGRAKVRQHERIRAKFQALKELIDCV